MKIKIASFWGLTVACLLMVRQCTGEDQESFQNLRMRRDHGSAGCVYKQDALDIVTNILNVANATSVLPKGAVNEMWNKYSGFLDQRCIGLIQSIKIGVTNVVRFCQEGEFASMNETVDQLKMDIETFQDKVDRRFPMTKLAGVVKSYMARMQDMRLKRLKQIEKGISLAVNKIMPHLINITDLRKAEEEFDLLGDNENDVVKETVSKTIAAGVKLSVLVAFATRIKTFPASFLAMELVFPEMKKRNLAQEYGVFTIYCQLQRIMSHETFDAVSDLMKIRHEQLLEDLLPHVESIMESLVKDIAAGNYSRPMQARSETAKAKIKEWYLAELAKRYMESNGADFQKIFTFANKIKSLGDECIILDSIWQQLEKINRREGFDALMVWLTTRYNQRFMEYDMIHIRFNHTDSSYKMCLQIAKARAPAYKHVLIRMYRSNMECGNTVIVNYLHQTFGNPVRVLLSDFLKESVTQLDVQTTEKFKKIVEAAKALPSLVEKCWAIEAMQLTLVRHQSLKTASNTLKQKFVAEVMGNSTFKELDDLEKKMCEIASYDPIITTTTIAPKIIVTIKPLDRRTSSCRIMNRDVWEPLYLSGFWKGRKVFTWTEDLTADDQRWNIVPLSGKESARLWNIGHHGYCFSKISGEQIPYGGGSCSIVNFHRVDDTYALLEVPGYFLRVSSSKNGARRDTYLDSVSISTAMSSEKYHWRLDC